ncbi:MAG: DoxX family protein [Gemmatimonadaceae bacterium]
MTPNTDVAEGHAGRSISRFLPTVARILMGLLFLVVGLNGFLNFIPQPSTPMPDVALAFMGVLMKTRYMLPLIAGTEAIVGVMLLSNRFVPLALVLLAPVVVNIFAFHLFLVPSGLGVAAVVVVLEIYLAWTYRNAYGPMLTMRAAPASK